MVNAIYETQVDSEHTSPAVYLNIIGAIISLMVFVGIVGWGAKMMWRDSSGVPVVKASVGPMRVNPVDPGGVLASHQGLTVNGVSSSQKKMSLKDRLQLAPRPINLHAEDQPTSILLANSALVTEEPQLTISPDGSIASGSVFMLSTSSNVPNFYGQEDTEKLDSKLVINSDWLGLRQSLRPRTRSLVSSALLSKDSGTDVPQVIVIGRPMAQLGAFKSRNIAVQAWRNLLQLHRNYLVGTQHIILEAEVDGVTIYRLRVHGFADLAAARRLCTALHGQNAECYSVLMN